MLEDCETCDELPDEGGGGPGPGSGPPPPPPPPMTVSGTFTFTDFRNSSSGLVSLGPSPIVDARVQVMRLIPGVGPFAAAEGSTDNTGFFSAALPFDSAAAVSMYQLRLYATNDAVSVRGLGAPLPFVLNPPETSGSLPAPGATLDFSTSVTNPSLAMHFNIAETVRVAHSYVEARQPDEGTLPQMAFQLFLNPIGSASFYDHFDNIVNLAASGGFSDDLILHEYGHYVSDQVSSHAPLPANHDGCTANFINEATNTGTMTRSPYGAAHAWMEAFANYFAGAVGAWAPASTFDPSVNAAVNGFFDPNGAFHPGLETQPGCPPSSNPAVVATFRGDTVENFVGGTLWDLADPANEPHDTLAGYADTIFDIVDNELDTNHNTAPTISDFVQAWRGRALPSAPLNAILIRHGIPIPPNTSTSIGSSASTPHLPRPKRSASGNRGRPAANPRNSTIQSNRRTPSRTSPSPSAQKARGPPRAALSHRLQHSRSQQTRHRPPKQRPAYAKVET